MSLMRRSKRYDAPFSPEAQCLHLQQSLDELLTEKVCKSLVERLSSQYLGQIVQILINLEHFEIACQELEQLLIRARSSTSAGGPVKLKATDSFRDNKKTAEKRIFELVNSKIDDLIDTAEYEWYVLHMILCDMSN
jgi:exocyst complex component 6